MENILGRHQPKNVPLPKVGSAARYVVDQWNAAENGCMRFSDLMGVYLFRLRIKHPRKQKQYAAMNLGKILRKYGFKSGKSGDRSPWVFGAQFPTPGTFGPPVASPAPLPTPSAKPPAYVFGLGDMVTCNKIGRAVVAEIVEKTPDGWFKIRWPNKLTDRVPGDLLQLVSPAVRDDMQYGGGDCCNDPTCPVEPREAEQEEYKSDKTRRLEQELEESTKADKLKVWAKQAVFLMRKEWSADQIVAVAEALRDMQEVDRTDPVDDYDGEDYDD